MDKPVSDNSTSFSDMDMDAPVDKHEKKVAMNKAIDEENIRKTGGTFRGAGAFIVAPAGEQNPHDNLSYTAVLKHDLDIGECMEMPISAITIDYGGYRVLAPLPVYQCTICYSVLAHKFNIADKVLRIQVCQRHKEKPPDDTTPGKLPR